MRLLHYSQAGGEIRIGVRRDDGRIIDLARAYARAKPGAAALPATIDGLLRDGLLAAVAAALPTGGPAQPDLAVDAATARIHSPLLNPGKIIGVGVNYVDHAQESTVQLPSEPVFFAKFANTVTGPFDPIRLPRVSEEVDWEGELVVVIGRRGRDIAEADAMSFVAGYTVGNDVSARDWQLRKPLRQWLVGKTFDTFLPLGPDLVTSDEIADPRALRLRCEVSGELMQDALTELHFSIQVLVSYLSQVLTLEPGDIFLTGTPGGVGQSHKPPRFLRDGDVVVTTIDKVGAMRNLVTRQPS